MEKNKREVTRAALLVMVAFAFSRALGLVRQMVFSRYFGTGPEMDAYVAAMRIPDMLFLIVAGGALGSAFIPIFTARLTRDEQTEAWELASAVINRLLLIIIPLSLGAMLLSPWLVRHLIAPALSPEIQTRTVTLMRVMLLSPAIFGVSGVIMGTLNAHQHFLLPALAPLLYNLATIAGALWGGNTHWGTMGPAIGMIAGALLHLGVQVPGLLYFSARYTPTLGLKDAAVRTVARLMAPCVLGVAVVQINMVITTALASTLGSGAISTLDYAWRLMLLPQGIFAQAVGTAIFPTFSAQAARGELGELRRTLTAMIRTLIAIILPATAGLIILGRPLIALIFERGVFSATSTHEVGIALALFALGLLGHSLIEILARAFYSLQDTWSPAGAAGGAMAINLILGLLLPALFAQAGWLPLGGLALANALAALLEMGVLFFIMERKIGGMPASKLLQWHLRPLGATLSMSAVLLCWLHFAPDADLFLSIGGVLWGTASYLFFAWLWRVEEVLTILTGLLKQVPTRS